MKKSALILMLCVSCACLAFFSFAAAESTEDAPAENPLTVDLDLSKMSGTIVYSQVYNMMYEPEKNRHNSRRGARIPRRLFLYKNHFK